MARDQDIAAIRKAINKRFNAAGEVSTVLAHAALDRLVGERSPESYEREIASLQAALAAECDNSARLARPENERG